MNLAAYRNYKTTEAPWLGDVPSHWEVRRLRTVLRLRNEKNSPVKTEQILSLSIARGVTLYSHQGRGGNKRKGDITAYKIAHAGDIVLNSMNVIVGAVGLSRYTGAISPVYYALFPATDEVDIKYYDKVFGNTAFQRYLLIYGKGILIKKSNTGKLNTIRMKISPDDLKGTLLPIPPIEEQQQIACFLDWKTAQINRFIRNKRRLIELLKEQKQNVINQAVTRGIDPNVKFKSSGVEWIGDIPEHWKAMRVKFLFAEREERKGDTEFELLSFSRSKGLVPFAEISSKPPSAEDLSKYKVCRPGHLLMNRMQAWSGMFTDVVIEGVVSPDYSVFEPIRPMSVAYFSYLFKTKRHVDEFAMASKGIGDGFNRLYTPAFGAIRTLCPPVDEQDEIVEFIKQETAIIDVAISRAEQEMELMREYRTRLISDVVTGKVDVRGIEVPEVAEEELLMLEDDTADADDVIDDEGDMDETD